MSDIPDAPESGDVIQLEGDALIERIARWMADVAEETGYFRISEGTVARTEEYELVADFDADGNPLGFEILRGVPRISSADDPP